MPSEERSYPRKENLSVAEQECLELSGRLMGCFATLPVLHPKDLAEMERDIHDIQNRILARAAYRAPPWKGGGFS